MHMLQVVVPMRLFPRKAIIEAQRSHAIHKTGGLESRRNTARGQDRPGGNTVITTPSQQG